MATVVSLTEQRIRELLSGWEGVELSQDQINALVAQLWTSQETLNAMMDALQNQTMPQLQQDLAESAIRVDDLNDVTLPQLEADLEQANAQIENLVTVDFPALALELNNEIENAANRPKVYRQPDEPSDPDIDERSLIVGDTWFDEDDNNTQYVWNGVEWSTLSVDVADFSLTVRKFMTTSHMIY